MFTKKAKKMQHTLLIAPDPALDVLLFRGICTWGRDVCLKNSLHLMTTI